eukprot:256232_1
MSASLGNEKSHKRSKRKINVRESRSAGYFSCLNLSLITRGCTSAFGVARAFTCASARKETKEILFSRPKEVASDECPKPEPVQKLTKGEKAELISMLRKGVASGDIPERQDVADFENGSKLSDEYFGKTYKANKIAGSGQFGQVMLVQRKSDNKDVILKQMYDPEVMKEISGPKPIMKEIMREFEFLKRLNHPNILKGRQWWFAPNIMKKFGKQPFGLSCYAADIENAN